MARDQRDDFSEPTKRHLALRANHRCSICDTATSGPSDEAPDKFVNIGVAAHIYAASPGGPRYDSTMMPAQRSHITNAIWLCQNHSVAIDRDTARYTPQELIRIKNVHESRTRAQCGTNSQRTFSDDLIAFGPDIICVGEHVGTCGDQWNFRIDHFVEGNKKILMDYSASFPKLARYNRYALSNTLGEGRELSAPLSWRTNKSSIEVACKVMERFARIDARKLPRSMATNANNDIFLENGNIAMVSGLDALPDNIKQTLSMLRGESPFYPDYGARLKEYFDAFDGSEWLARLVKLETVRLASIPYHDQVMNRIYTPLQCVLEVCDVTQLGNDRTKNWLPFRFDLEVEGVGRWSHDIRIFIPSGERPARPAWPDLG